MLQEIQQSVSKTIDIHIASLEYDIKLREQEQQDYSTSRENYSYLDGYISATDDAIESLKNMKHNLMNIIEFEVREAVKQSTLKELNPNGKS